MFGNIRSLRYHASARFVASFKKGSLISRAPRQVLPTHKWLFVHLMYIVEFSNRLIIFICWGIQYLTFSRGARLITGQDSHE